MAQRRKKEEISKPKKPVANAYIAGAGTIVDESVTETLKANFMPYAMSVIVSRAIPEIDGFKPSHRKLLYTMYNMGLLNGSTIKSANIVGRTMQLNPHGDAAIYDTMVRLSEGNGALLHPFVASKGSFGKAYSRDMQCAAARYTEAKLAPISAELFSDIDKDTVDFVDNYDATMKEPVLFPVTFPTVLVNANMGIAAGMASSICSFNLKEVCETTIAYIKDEEINVADTLIAPDFSIGGELLYNRAQMESIYETGRGSFKVRGTYTYDKANNCIDINSIPPTTTTETIIEKVVELVKAKKITEINDIRDETDLSGLQITIDLKRGTDPEKLMSRLYKMTPLQDSFACNFNILIASAPRVMGVKEIISEWVAFRSECVRRRVYFKLTKAKDKLHLLKGMQKILLDIDKAIKIVRETAEEKEVVPNLMIGFGIDEVQAEYVAEIKLRHLNREYILKRLEDIEQLQNTIDELRRQTQALQQRLEASENENRQLRQQNEQLQQQLREQQQQMAQLQQQLNACEGTTGVTDGKIFGTNAELGIVCLWPENVDVDLYVKDLATGTTCYYRNKNTNFGNLMEDVLSHQNNDDRYELFYQKRIVPGRYQIRVNIYEKAHWTNGNPAHVSGFVVLHPGKANQTKIPYELTLTRKGEFKTIGTLIVTQTNITLQ